MATIALYANKLNQMPGLVKDVKKTVTDYTSELFSIRKKSLQVNKSICNLDDVISSIQASTRTQEEKADALNELDRKSEQFIVDTARIDEEVADLVRQRKDDFYEKYSYLKPECEKSGWEKFCDGCQKAKEWCKEHWKLLVTIVIVIAAVAVIVFFPAAAPILMLAAKGAIIGAVAGGLLGGVTSLIAGEDFWKGFEDGAFSGAISGAIFGGLGGAGRMFGGSCRIIEKLGGVDKVFRVISNVAKISGGITVVMGGFDMIALGIGLFDPSNPLVVLNQKLHSSKLYNVFQFSAAAVAAFSGGAYLRMRQGPPSCFVAGTMILTAAGLAAIENIRAGDKVISTNTDTFEVAEKVVVETYIRKVSKLVHLKVNGEMIDTTVDHPFYVKDVGFVDAGRLTVGDKLLDPEGSILMVENVWIEVTDTPVEVYNFQVADFHTYHVGNNGALVHNANDYANPNTVSTSELDVNEIRKTTNEGKIQSGGRSGGSRPLQGQKPNSYLITDGGHTLVYGADGRLNLDISPQRVKATVWDMAPNGVLYPRDIKLIGPVPESLLKGW